MNFFKIKSLLPLYILVHTRYCLQNVWQVYGNNDKCRLKKIYRLKMRSVAEQNFYNFTTPPAPPRTWMRSPTTPQGPKIMEKTAINISPLDLSMRLFTTLVTCADDAGHINIPQPELAKYLSVSRQTIGNHLHKLCDSNILKFKFSGKGMLNPDFIYKGDYAMRHNVVDEFTSFKSDF